MATQKLTDRAIQAAQAVDGQRLELWDETTPGLCLRVSSGKGSRPKKVWIWRYRGLDGRQPRLSLADYSETRNLKWARDEVEELRVRVRRGEDPAAAERDRKAKERTEPLRTFDDLADAFLAASAKGHWKPRRKQKRTNTIATETAVLKRNVRPVLGKMRLEDINRRTVRKIRNDMIDRGIGATVSVSLIADHPRQLAFKSQTMEWLAMLLVVQPENGFLIPLQLVALLTCRPLPSAR